MSAANYITLAVAIVGAVTGLIATGLAIWSLYRQIDQDRVKLRVGVGWALQSHAPETPFLAVSVTNLSTFPVTLSDVGLLIDDDKQRAVHPDMRTHDGRQLPVRMEPRTSISVYFPPGFLLDPRLKSARCAYARTDCGENAESSPDIVTQMVAEALNE